MIEVLAWSFLLRFVQCLLQASPFILVGLLVAAVFHRLLGPRGTRLLFGSGTWRALLQAWAVGMLLPVCSLGVIPVVRRLRLAGVAGGTILAFAMSAPLFNPLSVLYGLTLSEPFTIICFTFCSLVLVTVLGLLFDRLFPNTEDAGPPPAPVDFGIKRMLALGTSATRELVGPSLVYILIGLAGVALLGIVLPHGSLQRSVNHDRLDAPLTMALIAVPVYATPMLAMSQLGSMFQHANSIGAALTLLMLGAGMNLGLLAWMARNYGVVRSGAWFLMLLAVVLVMAYAVERPLFPAEIEPADHTHAFDIYCRPFPHPPPADLALAVGTKLQRDIAPFEWYSLFALAALAAVGLGLQLFDRRQRIEAWLERPADESAPRRFDVIVPGSVLGGITLVGLIAMSVLGCFVYYPRPSEALKELQGVKGELLGAVVNGDPVDVEYWVELFDDWTRKLEVGAYLRQGHLSEYHRIKSRILRDKLELLEHAVEDGEEKLSRMLVSEIVRGLNRLEYAYLHDDGR